MKSRFLILLILLFPAVLALVPANAAETCHKPTQTVVATPVVAVTTPVVVPVAIPFALFQFVSPPTVPATVAVAAGQLPQPKDTGLEQRLAALEQNLASLASKAPSGGPPLIRRSSQTPATRQPVGTSTGPVPVGQIASLLQQGCAQCHTSPGRGDVDLFDAAGVFNPNVSRDEIYRSIRSDRMPKTPSKISVADKELLRLWAKEKTD